MRRWKPFASIPLSAKLAALTLAIGIPVALAFVGHSSASSAQAAMTLERRGFTYIALATRVQIDAGRMRVRRNGSRAAIEPSDAVAVARDIRGLDAFAATTLSTVPEAGSGVRAIRDAWQRAVAAPSGPLLASFADTIFHAVSGVSDGTRISFESHVDSADVGDALDNPFLLQYGRLSAASFDARLGFERGRPSVDDRIAIAGFLARAEAAGEPLRVDMTGAFGEDSALETTLARPWADAENAVARLDASLAAIVRGRPGRLREVDVQRQTVDLLARAERFDGDLQRAAQAILDRRSAEEDAAQRRLTTYALLAAALGAALAWALGGLIAARDRRELVRLQQNARTLEAELARRRAEHALLFTQAQFRAIFDRSDFGIATLDAGGAAVECNAAFTRMFGVDAGPVVPPGAPAFSALLAGREASYHFERAVETVAGERLWVEITISSIAVHEPSAVVAIAMVADITERKAADERLRYAASHDALTGLDNRASFVQRLEERIGAGRSDFAVLFIDLDDFKLVNDGLGHRAGDRVLAATARRLQAASRPGDVAARFHGDEFAMLLDGVTDVQTARAIAERLQHELRAPVSVDGTPCTTSPSIGIVLPREPASAEDVLRDADAAMYRAKSLGRATSVVFDDAMTRERASRTRIKTDLRAGVERGEFRMAYQPVIDLMRSTTVGFEALMRWQHPVHGDIPPGEFIPIAEESDAILLLGRFALRESCAMLARCDRTRPPESPLQMSVNLSVAQLYDPAIVDDVEGALRDAGVDPARLVLEITETTLLENSSRAAAVLAQLKALGVRLCVDDFGTGYSSLRYLNEFPIDALKIDGSFVHGPGGEIANRPIVDMLLKLGRSLDMRVVAEGIETERQRIALRGAGCRYGQGFLFARGLFESDALAFLEGGEGRLAVSRLYVAPRP